jgi:hypothetical protein
MSKNIFGGDIILLWKNFFFLTGMLSTCNNQSGDMKASLGYIYFPNAFFEMLHKTTLNFDSPKTQISYKIDDVHVIR